MAAERLRGHGGDRKLQRAIAAAVEEAVEPAKVGRKRRPRRRGGEVPSEPLNEPFSFITFIAAHQLGVEVEGTVDEFSSHGAFISVDGARCYVPLSAMSEVPPRSAREVLRKGERRVFVVQAFDAMRRGIELALPGFASPAGTPTAETIDAEIHRAEAGLVIASEQPAHDHPGPGRGAAKARGVSRLARKSISAQPAPTTEAARPTKAATKRAVGQPKPSPVAKRPAPAKAAPASGQPGDKVVGNRAGANKTNAHKAVANKTSANKAGANKAVANKASANKASAKKARRQKGSRAGTSPQEIGRPEGRSSAGQRPPYRATRSGGAFPARGGEGGSGGPEVVGPEAAAREEAAGSGGRRCRWGHEVVFDQAVPSGEICSREVTRG